MRFIHIEVVRKMFRSAIKGFEDPKDFVRTCEFVVRSLFGSILLFYCVDSNILS